MNQNDIVFKTAAGAAEITARSRKLPQRLRTMLIMVDGNLSAGHLTEAAKKLGAPADFLETLQQQGLIAARPQAQLATAATTRGEISESDRFRVAQRFMNDTVVDALGFRALFFTLKLERCVTRADLAALLEPYAKAVAKGSGEDVARVLVGRARDMLT